ncbi:arylamine N-acetyltransferase family protein [Microbacterium sp.]|uniref:arylamine N-acetyltransferase family protein n=1 Tax=Microbacterium sp. TaxID=51671 RepID=UPI003A8E2482
MTTAPSLDLDRYFARIGYAGDAARTRAVLDEIIARHTSSIPFENLDPFLGTPNRLDLASLQRKLIDGRRGGYCFEQNLLLRTVLLSMGFAVRALSARVLWRAAPDAVNPRSHMLLLVTVDGEQRIADVGFGGLGLTTSLAFDSALAQPTPLEPFRLVHADGEHTLQAQLGETWHPLYRFDLQAQLPVDYEASNWYLSTSPTSKFVTTLTAARATSDRRYALAGRRFTTHRPGQPSQHVVLEDAAALRRVLEERLLIETSALDVDRAFAQAQA